MNPSRELSLRSWLVGELVELILQFVRRGVCHLERTSNDSNDGKRKTLLLLPALFPCWNGYLDRNGFTIPACKRKSKRDEERI